MYSIKYSSKTDSYFWHLWVTEVFVDNDALHEHGVLQLSTDFRLDLDQLEVDVSSFHVGHRQDGVDGDLRHLTVTFVDTDAKKRNIY